MSELPSGPIRDFNLSPLHRRCLGRFLEQAAVNLDKTDTMRCLCLDCRPGQIELEAWRLYWRASVREVLDAGLDADVGGADVR